MTAESPLPASPDEELKELLAQIENTPLAQHIVRVIELCAELRQSCNAEDWTVMSQILDQRQTALETVAALATADNKLFIQTLFDKIRHNDRPLMERAEAARRQLLRDASHLQQQWAAVQHYNATAGLKP